MWLAPERTSRLPNDREEIEKIVFTDQLFRFRGLWRYLARTGFVRSAGGESEKGETTRDLLLRHRWKSYCGRPHLVTARRETRKRELLFSRIFRCRGGRHEMCGVVSWVNCQTSTVVLFFRAVRGKLCDVRRK